MLEAIAVSVAGGVCAIALLVLFDVTAGLFYLDLGAFIAGSLAARGIHMSLRSR